MGRCRLAGIDLNRVQEARSGRHSVCSCRLRPQLSVPCCPQAKQGAGGPFLTQAPTHSPGHSTSPAAAAGGSRHREPVARRQVAPSGPKAGAAVVWRANAAHPAAQPGLLPSQLIGAGGHPLSELPSQRMLRPSSLPSSRIPPGVKSPPLVLQAAPSATAWNARPAGTARAGAPALAAAAVGPATGTVAAASRAGPAQPAGDLSPRRPPEALIPAFTGESPGGQAGCGSGEEEPGSSGGQSGVEGAPSPRAQLQQRLSQQLAAPQQPEQGQRSPRAAHPLQQQGAVTPQRLQPSPPSQGVLERRLSGGFLDILTRIASPLPSPSKPGGSPLLGSTPGSPPPRVPKAASPPSALQLPPGAVQEPGVAAEAPAAAGETASAAPAASADRAATTDAGQVRKDGMPHCQPCRACRRGAVL